MDANQRATIEALLPRIHETTEEELALGRQVHGRAAAILAPLNTTRGMQIIYGSDDDRMIDTKRKTVHYKSEAGECWIILTNFHKNKLDTALAVEVLKDGRTNSIRDPEYLFAVTPNGQITSPLSLVNADIAGSLLELFEED